GRVRWIRTVLADRVSGLKNVFVRVGDNKGENLMKLRISRDELLTGLQRVQGVVEKRNTMPILSNILLEAKADGVDILATDLEIGMRGLYKATVEEPGSV